MAKKTTEKQKNEELFNLLELLVKSNAEEIIEYEKKRNPELIKSFYIAAKYQILVCLGCGKEGLENININDDKYFLETALSLITNINIEEYQDVPFSGSTIREISIIELLNIAKKMHESEANINVTERLLTFSKEVAMLLFFVAVPVITMIGGHSTVSHGIDVGHSKNWTRGDYDFGGVLAGALVQLGFMSVGMATIMGGAIMLVVGMPEIIKRVSATCDILRDIYTLTIQHDLPEKTKKAKKNIEIINNIQEEILMKFGERFTPPTLVFGTYPKQVSPKK